MTNFGFEYTNIVLKLSQSWCYHLTNICKGQAKLAAFYCKSGISSLGYTWAKGPYSQRNLSRAYPIKKAILPVYYPHNSKFPENHPNPLASRVNPRPSPRSPTHQQPQDPDAALTGLAGIGLLDGLQRATTRGPRHPAAAAAAGPRRKRGLLDRLMLQVPLPWPPLVRVDLVPLGRSGQAARPGLLRVHQSSPDPRIRTRTCLRVCTCCTPPRVMSTAAAAL